MSKYRFRVSMEYVADNVEVEADDEESARNIARDMAGDGLLLAQSDISSVDIFEI